MVPTAVGSGADDEDDDDDAAAAAVDDDDDDDDDPVSSLTSAENHAVNFVEADACGMCEG